MRRRRQPKRGSFGWFRRPGRPESGEMERGGLRDATREGAEQGRARAEQSKGKQSKSPCPLFKGRGNGRFRIDSIRGQSKGRFRGGDSEGDSEGAAAESAASSAQARKTCPLRKGGGALRGPDARRWPHWRGGLAVDPASWSHRAGAPGVCGLVGAAFAAEPARPGPARIEPGRAIPSDLSSARAARSRHRGMLCGSLTVAEPGP